MDAQEIHQVIEAKRQSILTALARLQELTPSDVSKAITNDVDASDVVRELTDIDSQVWDMVDFLTLVSP